MPKLYIWEKHDDIIGITTKLTGSADCWPQLLDQNRAVIRDNNHLMRAGDEIVIPEGFPLNEQKYRSTLVKRLLSQKTVTILAKVNTDELDISMYGDVRIPRGFVRVTAAHRN